MISSPCTSLYKSLFVSCSKCECHISHLVCITHLDETEGVILSRVSCRSNTGIDTIILEGNNSLWSLLKQMLKKVTLVVDSRMLW
jgi:hypothetical protein